VKKVAVVMGSASDLPLAKDALKTLAAFEIPAVARVLSAHRTPDLLFDYARQAAGRGLHCVIGGAANAGLFAAAVSDRHIGATL